VSTDLLEVHRRAVEPFLAETRRLRPPEAEVIDVHTHLGLDEDGRSLSLAELLAMLDQADARRACVFPLHDPERRPAYRVPNDRVLEWASQSDGRLVPFCRLDPADSPVAEGERCLARGARGIKLHPRAQEFAFEGDAIAAIFALAEQAEVPILIHAGRGLPPIADGLADLALRHPGAVLILAHGAIADQGMLTDALSDHPGVLYDVSCFSAIDVLALYARVPAERIVFGSDPPYGHTVTGLYGALRIAAAVGLDEAATRLMLGGTVGALLDGRGLPPTTPPRGTPDVTLLGPLARVYVYLTMSVPSLFVGNIEQALGGLELALAGCRDPHPGAAAAALEDLGPALSAAIALVPVEELRRQTIDLAFRCLTRAATERATTEQPVTERAG
jgi:predicted TIM-barrel fold metal-dependent hydrolase